VTILSHLDLHALGDKAARLSEPAADGSTKTRAEVVSEIVDGVDALIPFDLFPPWGTVADLLDGPVVKLLVNLILAIGHARKKKRGASVHAELKVHVDAAIAAADALSVVPAVVAVGGCDGER
jgi:hypothetical protein